MHIFLLIFGICGKVSPSKSCSYVRVPDSLLAEWEKSRVGLEENHETWTTSQLQGFGSKMSIFPEN